jgi:hypothetical protein
MVSEGCQRKQPNFSNRKQENYMIDPTNTTETDSTSAIDKAIAKAQARKAAKAGVTDNEGTLTPVVKRVAKEKPVKAPKAAKVPDAEKVAAKAAKDAERAARKLERDAARALKRSEREAAKPSAHMSKVERAASKLPALTEEAQVMFSDITSNLGRDQVAAIALHLGHFNRVQATQRALSQKVAAGDEVRILGGDPRYVGMTGTVSKAQRIRCYVTVEGVNKPIYLFTSDVDVLSSVSADAAAVG